MGCCLFFNLYYVVSYWGWDNQLIPPAHFFFMGYLPTEFHFSEIIILIMPVIVSMVFATSAVDDRRLGLPALLYTRSSAKHYASAKLTTGFLGTFFVFFAPLCIGLLLHVLGFPLEGDRSFDNQSLFGWFARSLDGMAYRYTDSHDFPGLFYLSPYLYDLFYAFLYSLFAGVASVFAGGISLFVRKSKLLVLAPFFLFTILLNWLEMIVETVATSRGKALTVHLSYRHYVMAGAFHPLDTWHPFWYVFVLMTVLIYVGTSLARLKQSKDFLD
jgi:hypothetical protein